MVKLNCQMKNKPIIFLVIGVLFLPVVSALGQNTTPWQRDVRPYRQRQREQREDYKQYFRQQNYTLMKERLARNKKLIEQEKEDLINFFQSQQEIRYEKVISLNDPKYTEDLALFEKIANDPNIEFNDKKTAIKAYFDKIKKSP